MQVVDPMCRSAGSRDQDFPARRSSLRNDSPSAGQTPLTEDFVGPAERPGCFITTRSRDHFRASEQQPDSSCPTDRMDVTTTISHTIKQLLTEHGDERSQWLDERIETPSACRVTAHVLHQRKRARSPRGEGLFNNGSVSQWLH